MSAQAEELGEWDSATCVLEGVSCAGCIAKIEQCLSAIDGVVLARGNATQKRLRLVWDPDQTSQDALFDAISGLGYKAFPYAAQNGVRPEKSLLPQLALAGFATLNIMAFSFSVWIGAATDMGPGTMQFMHWLSAAITVPVVIYAGSVFFAPALRAACHGRLNMDVPISIAILVTLAASIFETLRGSEHVYYDAVVSLIFLLLIGRVLDQTLRRRSGNAAENLRQMMSERSVNRLAANSIEIVPAASLRPGDRILVEAGEHVPVDARVLDVAGYVDESVLTGESLPRSVMPGDAIAAGSIIAGGPLTLEVTHVGDASQLGRMADMMEQAAAHKGQMQRMADGFASAYVPLVLIGGSLGFLLWYGALGAGGGDALMIAVAVLVVTCPCAAGLATPAVTSRALNKLLHAGIVVKSGDALERIGQVDLILADKTGSLTTAELRLDGHSNAAGLLAQAAPLAAGSSHPLARIVAAKAPCAAICGLREEPGRGLIAPDGAKLGSAAFVGAADENADAARLWFKPANGRALPIGFEDVPRADLETFLQTCRALDLPVAVLSGDTVSAVRRFGERHGIDQTYPAHHPAEKLAVVSKAQDAGKRPLMLGDGINDAPALGGAYASASFAAASQISQNAADIVLLRPELCLLTQTLSVARTARRLIRQNLTFSMIYNVVSVPLALAGFLTPLVAAILMSSSSIIVLCNGLRIRVQ